MKSDHAAQAARSDAHVMHVAFHVAPFEALRRAKRTSLQDVSARLQSALGDARTTIESGDLFRFSHEFLSQAPLPARDG